jgi:hypothetical protein
VNPSVFRYVLAYLFWAVTVALAVVDLLLWRTSVMVVLGMTPWDRFVEHALNQFGFLFLAIAGLAVIVFAEHYYRTGVEENRLFPRFFLLTLIGMIVLTLAHLVRLVGEIALGFFTPLTLLVLVVELAICVALFLLYRRTNRTTPQLV